jgi:hypothetical protein
MSAVPEAEKVEPVAADHPKTLWQLVEVVEVYIEHKNVVGELPFFRFEAVVHDPGAV